MTKTNRLISIILAFVLSCTMLPAAALAEASEGAAQAQESQEVQTEGSTAGDQDAVSSEPASESTSSAGAEAAEDPQIAAVEDQASSDAAALADEAVQIAPEEALKMIAVGQAEVAAGDEQQIPVFLLDEDQTVEQAELALKHSSGTERRVQAAECVRYAANFLFSTSGWDEGFWKVAQLAYTTEVGSFYIDLSGADNLGFTIIGSSQEGEVDTTFYAIEEDDVVETDTLDEALSIAEEGTNAVTPLATTASRAGAITIGLDAGHGYGEAGASANGAHEEVLTEKIANYCADELRSYANVTVVFSHGGDRQDRVVDLKNQGAQVVVSFHINAGGGTGVEVYAPNNNYNAAVGAAGQALAQAVLDELLTLGLNDRGVKINTASQDKYPDGSLADNFGIQYWSKIHGIPGILIEHCFIDSSDYFNFLDSEEKLERLGVADATGIAAYYGLQKTQESAYAGVYDYEYYKNAYPDLQSAFGNKRNAYLQHFLNLGLSEGRQASPVFNINYYMGAYPDLASLNTSDPIRYAQHFLSVGMGQGRQACTGFDVASYYNLNADLRNAFGSKLPSYYLHYVEFGAREGRAATGAPEITAYRTVLNGVDHAPVYDGSYYLKQHSDLQRAYTTDHGYASLVDDKGLLEHFVAFGMAEGRQGSASFDVVSYYNAHPDLRQAFGTNTKNLYNHYLTNGRREGRQATSVSEMKGYATTLNFVNYAPVYDCNYYCNEYSDLRNAYTKRTAFVSLMDDKGLLEHFVAFGMAEGRQGSASFDVVSYYNAHPDLRQAFGTNTKNLYNHYLTNGRREGRQATGASELKGFISTLNGVNYAPVYDGSYYCSSYPDLRSAFLKRGTFVSFYDDRALLEHFVVCGMAEGRKGSTAFDVNSYYMQYPDLRRTFGTDWKKYYLHYLTSGIKEGRAPVGCTEFQSDGYSAIMGQSQVTAAQMARRYRAVGRAYPSSVYAQYGAATIDQFCSILLEEAQREGVRAEVVFAQAMHETGWLQFGNDVQADQCNFAGIGATGGVPGNSFNDWGADSVRKGLRAQVQHLKAYASKDALNGECVDPRFTYVTRGCAPSVYDLGGKWAVSSTYGERLMEQMEYLLRA